MATTMSDATFQFLSDLRDHNDREWFNAHKHEYEANVRDPALALIADMVLELPKISPFFIADPRPVGGSLMRIYRDTRFSKDKSPYKASIAARFHHRDGHDGGTPGFYVRIAPGNCGVGGGIWQPDSDTLERIRQKIVAEPKRWTEVTRGQALRSTCGFVGESLKRAPQGYDPNHALIDDLKRKDFALSIPVADEAVKRPNFTETLVKTLGETAPFVRFLSEACGLKF